MKIEEIRKGKPTLILKSIADVGNTILRIEDNCVNIKLLIFGDESVEMKVIELPFNDTEMEELRNWLCELYGNPANGEKEFIAAVAGRHAESRATGS